MHAATFLIAGPMRAPNAEEATTPKISEAIRIHPIGTEGKTIVIYPSLVIGFVLCAALWFWLRNTPKGFELRATGLSEQAARFAGANTRVIRFWALSVSGAIAGLGGALHLLGQEGRYSEGFSPGFGFDSLGVALLAGSSPFGVIPAALLFAAIDQGAVRAQVACGLPKEISALTQGLIILCFAAVRYRQARLP
jgi:simple sugar transport system permease protein